MCDAEFFAKDKPGQRFSIVDLANGLMAGRNVKDILPAHFDPCDEKREREAEEKAEKGMTQQPTIPTNRDAA